MSFSQLLAVKKDIIFGVHLKQISYYFGALEIKSCKFLAYELELLWFFFINFTSRRNFWATLISNSGLININSSSYLGVYLSWTKLVLEN